MGALKQEFSWSRSKDRTFDECLRKYWFSTYGHWGGWEPWADDRTRAIYVLKKLHTRYMWAGDLVHRTIAETLAKWRGGVTVDPAGVPDETIETMRKEFRESKGREYWKDPKRKCGLMEHEYQESVTDDAWKQLADHVRHCLGKFFASPFASSLPALPRDAWLSVEDFGEFRIAGTKTFVKLDAAWRDGGVVIVDWKTGKRDGEPDPIQLACYALYALDQGWADAPEKVRTIEYNLYSGRSHEESITADRIDEVRDHVRSRVGEMAKLDGRPEAAFPVTTDAAACRDCNYRRVCPDRPGAR